NVTPTLRVAPTGSGVSIGASTSVNAGLSSIVIFWIVNPTLGSWLAMSSASLTVSGTPARVNGMVIVGMSVGVVGCGPKAMLRFMQVPVRFTVASGRRWLL